MTSLQNEDLRGALSWAAETIGPVTGVRRLSGGWTSTMLALTGAHGETSVLRLMDRKPWRAHGPELTTREHLTLERLAGSGLPVATSLALDADGRHWGHPAHLMSLLPGSVQVERHDDDSLARLADLLASIHAAEPSAAVRPYESWAFEAKYRVPSWTYAAATWEAAFEVLRSEPPAFEPTFIHRDFQPRNVLWEDGGISGVVDWVETSIGPAWLDVAHCLTSLTLWHGSDVADAFAAAYVHRTGRTPQPYFEVMDLVAFLPAPGRQEYVVDPEERVRFEARLATVLRRLSRRTEP
jgi:aminoglycoside phosphotransferase (APT) family kinase protein